MEHDHWLLVSILAVLWWFIAEKLGVRFCVLGDADNATATTKKGEHNEYTSRKPRAVPNLPSVLLVARLLFSVHHSAIEITHSVNDSFSCAIMSAVLYMGWARASEIELLAPYNN